MGHIVAVENLNLNASVKYSVHVVSVMEPLVIQCLQLFGQGS